MLLNIKSKFFFNKIFSFINEGRKLKLVKYNKNIQNAININLLNYKLFTWKYIIYENKGYAKEYNYNDDLVFEGV